jgi:hypothetical protein
MDLKNIRQTEHSNTIREYKCVIEPANDPMATEKSEFAARAYVWKITPGGALRGG